MLIVFQLIPARGRKLYNCTSFQIHIDISTYPRKGTETHRHCFRRCTAAHFNLSPQGDGNFYIIIFSISRQIFQLIPARGRKPQGLFIVVELVAISTYPRKGTETYRPTCSGLFGIRISTYPRKGTETDRHRLGRWRSSISTYPRKGTETFTSRCVPVCFYYFNLSPQGDGNVDGSVTAGKRLYFNLSPQGDGN